jgi:hypothetical protein
MPTLLAPGGVPMVTGCAKVRHILPHLAGAPGVGPLAAVEQAQELDNPFGFIQIPPDSMRKAVVEITR